MSYNVLAVYDVLATRIGKRKGINPFLPPPLRLQGCQNVGGVSRGSEATGRPTQANGTSSRRTGGVAYTDLLCDVLNSFYYHYLIPKCILFYWIIFNFKTRQIIITFFYYEWSIIKSIFLPYSYFLLSIIIHFSIIFFKVCKFYFY